MSKQYTTPDLPYAYDALEPYIDKQTMMIHHDKHHAAYTTKLNAAIAKHSELFRKESEDLLRDLDSVPEDIRMAVRNNGGGHVNHSFFWEVMGPDSGGQPDGELMEAINKDFGSFEIFQEMFEQAATTQFGSGWAWLSLDGDKLVVEQTPNQDTPLSAGRTSILALDVWEHAYYVDYRNVRPEYVSAIWDVINWDTVEKRLVAAQK